MCRMFSITLLCSLTDHLSHTILEFLVSGFAVMAVAGLACFHTQLIVTMRTTNEDVRYLFVFKPVCISCL